MKRIKMTLLAGALGLLAATGAAQQPTAAQVALLDATIGGASASVMGPFWFQDDAGQRAIGLTYPEIEGAAGNFGIFVGYYAKQGDSFALVAPLDGIYGTDPREVKFTDDLLTLTTTMPNPDDPRCCPTGEGHWRVTLGTLAIDRLD